MIFFAAPSPASEAAAAVCGTATGSETLLAMLALDAAVGALDTTDGATSVGAALEADVRALTTLLSSW
jgi:hypothetical protein